MDLLVSELNDFPVFRSLILKENVSFIKDITVSF